MNEELIIKEWLHGHSKAWLIEKKIEALKWDKENNPDTIYTYYTARELKYEAQRLVEDALLKWWREQVKEKGGGRKKKSVATQNN